MTETHEEIPHDGVVHETDMAVLFALADGNRWIPKSVIDDWNGKTATVAVWWLEQEELL